MLKLKENNEEYIKSERQYSDKDDNYLDFINFLKNLNFDELNKKYNSVTKILNLLMGVELAGIVSSLLFTAFTLIYYIIFSSSNILYAGLIGVHIFVFSFIGLYITSKKQEEKVDSLEKYFYPQDLMQYNEIVNYLHSKQGKSGLENLYKNVKKDSNTKILIDNLISGLNNENHVDVMFSLKMLCESLRNEKIIIDETEADIFFAS